MEEYKNISKLKILVVDDNSKFLSEMKVTLSNDYNVTTVESAQAAMMIMTTQEFNLILLDYSMPVMSGFEFLKILKKRDKRDIPVIMLTGKSDSDTIIQTMQTGATDYVIKGADDFVENLKFRISMALEKTAIVKQNKKLEEKIQSQTKYVEIIGSSSLAMKLKLDILKLKGTSAFVLITGENGTGKELIAQNLNIQEEDPARPFIAVNCTAIYPSLFESELFGHEKGAFTGAIEKRIGKFQAADGGDIFLDEIGDIPLELQAKLLRVLQEKVITPVGSNKEIPINIRVITATNKNLENEVANGRFRQDLYYRLSKVCIYSPSLRERKEDIVQLAEVFLKRYLPLFKLTAETKKALVNYPWPGNIRELVNIIERASINARDSKRPIITVEHLKLKEAINRPMKESVFIPAQLLPTSKEEISNEGHQDCINWGERIYIERCLKLMEDDNRALYTKLNISKAQYYKRKKALGLSSEQVATV